MDKPINLAHERLKRDFVNATVQVATLTQDIPHCKLIQDFLAHHNLLKEALLLVGGLSHAQVTELNQRMLILVSGIEAERAALRDSYGVDSEDELPPEQRKFFDAAVRAYIEREDHYP